MFQTIEIAKRIRQARIEKNMTQMNLAEAMGVSYQAVSSWERGNAMPDIAKLEDLCDILDMDIDMLLGIESKAATAVNRVLRDEPLTIEDLTEVAPIMPPQQVKEKAEESRESAELNLSAIVGLAPFLDEAYLDELVQNLDDYEDVDGLIAIAPFLSQTTLDQIAAKVTPENLEDLIGIAPFLSMETLDQLAYKCSAQANTSSLSALAPFLSQQTLDSLVAEMLRTKSAAGLEALYPFLSSSTLRNIADQLMKGQDLNTLKGIMPFI